MREIKAEVIARINTHYLRGCLDIIAHIKNVKCFNVDRSNLTEVRLERLIHDLSNLYPEYNVPSEIEWMGTVDDFVLIKVTWR